MVDVTDVALLGDYLALDFVNTVENRAGAQPVDVLRTPADLTRWGERLGLLGAEPGLASLPAATPAELAAARRFREQLHAVLTAVVEQREPRADELGAVEREVMLACDARALAPGAGAMAWRWRHPSAATIRHEVALAAAELLTDPALLARTRRCPGEGCGWFYLDRSKNGSRRWCSMRGCGTRAKSRRRSQRAHRD